ncbi:MAG: hypothetical protein RL417_822 [Pseudomonadota bacterium]|jgi:exodeoxyribonuclease VII small subunit
MAKVIGFDELLDEKGQTKLKDLSFEEGLKLLEELVTKVESGSLPLDRSVLAYERGVALMDHLRGLLSAAEKKLEMLQRQDPTR